MGDKVVSLRSGDPIPEPGVPDADVVADLERVLEMARNGEIVGIAYACEHQDHLTGSHFGGRVTRRLVGALFGLMNRVSDHIENAP